MNQPFEVTADGQVRIVGAVIRDNARHESGESALAQTWSVLLKRNAQGQIIAAGFKVSQ
ncbi:hypothetical protein [Pseudomonas thivervalensis]|uniref:hypothetical protein n=1 Tax=Pseudomonas thivervalensis TaxID=86265 RepID=UPI0012E323F0|nr:hypothetical protein [Pseudomonas thivervalensis]